MHKILIVDDNKENVRLLKDFVESWGYQVIYAFDGREAIDMVYREKPDAILLDVMLPGKSGYEICQELKEDGAVRDIPIILVTALNESEDRIHGFKVGADNFLSKPVPYAELKVMLENMVAKKMYVSRMEKRQLLLNVVLDVLILDGRREFKDNRKVQRYGKRLANMLNFNDWQQENILFLLDIYRLLSGGNGEENIAIMKIFEQCSFADWLKTMLIWIEDCENSRMQQSSASMNSWDREVASVVASLSVYFHLLEQGKSEEAAFTDMKGMVGTKKFEQRVISCLEQVVRDEKFLAELGRQG